MKLFRQKNNQIPRQNGKIQNFMNFLLETIKQIYIIICRFENSSISISKPLRTKLEKLKPLSWEMNNSFAQKMLSMYIRFINLIMYSAFYTFYITNYFLNHMMLLAVSNI